MNRSKKIEAIIFDLGRVLVKVDLAKGIFRHIEELRQTSDVEIMENLFSDGVYQDFARGMIAAADFHKMLCGHLGLSLSYEEFVQEWCTVLEPMPCMEELVADLSRLYEIGLLSDIGPIHWEYLLKSLPVLQKIKNPVVSFQSGVLKPQVRAYELAAQSVCKAIEKCLFIDDRKVNVDGAIAAGMQAVQFHSAQELIDDLHEIGILS